MTEDEKIDLREWTVAGNSVYDNPYFYSDDHGAPMDFINAIRMDNDLRLQHEERLKKRNVTKVVIACITTIRKAEEICLKKAIDELIRSGTIDVSDCSADLLDGFADLLAGVYDDRT